MRILQQQIQHTRIQSSGVKKFCRFCCVPQLFNIIILAIRDVGLSKKEICRYIEVLCNLDDISVPKHFGFAL